MPAFHVLTVIIALVAAQALGKQRTVYTGSELQTAAVLPAFQGIEDFLRIILSKVLEFNVLELIKMPFGYSSILLAVQRATL